MNNTFPKYIYTLVCLGCILCGGNDKLSAQGRKFTVMDSIEMRRFTDPYPDDSRTVTKFSPDGENFVIVTTHGLIAKNLLESSIWLFNVKSEQDFLTGDKHSSPPRPQILVTRDGANDSEQQELQTAILSPKWSIDGKSLLFLGRNGDTTWHLYRFTLQAKRLEQISPNKQNVISFEERGRVIAFAVSKPWMPAPVPRVVFGTGESLHNLMFPDKHLSYPNQNELWSYSHNRVRPVIDSETHNVVHLNTHYGDTILSCDPTGRYVIVAEAVTSIPEVWASYEPGHITGRIIAWPPERLKQAFGIDIPERLNLVDLETGRTSIVFDAPLGRDVNWVGPTKVVWSSDGKKILLSNVFLPITGVSEKEKEDRTRQPVVVQFSLRDHTWSRVTRYSHSSLTDSKKWQVKDAKWGETADEVWIVYTELGPPTKVFHLVNGNWVLARQLSKGQDSNEVVPSPLVVTLRESLTKPPALFAALSNLTEEMSIWNPNPQLAQIALGKEEIFNWKDSDGREIKGVLIKPPDYDPRQTYPLVIEPRSYSQNVFVIDGTYPTAVAAQAMVADGLMVLQAGEPSLPPKDSLRKGVSAALIGYEAAIDKLTAEGLVDPHRVGIVGFSRTCDNVMFAITQNPGLFAAATIANGFTYGPMGYFDIVDATVYNGAMDQWALHYGGKPFGDGEAAYLKENPIFNLRKVTAPLRIETHDTSFMLTEWESYAGLRSLDKPVDLIVLPYATHVVTMPSDLMESQQGDVDWFRFWLQGYEDPDLAKRPQYKRWEGLRKLRDANALAAKPIRASAQPND